MMKKNKKANLARIIKAVISDVDGVFTDSRVLEGAPYKAKWRSYYDGQGVSLLRAIGLRVCLITNEKGNYAKHIIDAVEKWNNLPSSEKTPDDSGWYHVKLYIGVGGEKKVAMAERWLKEVGLRFDQCAFIGDDLLDIPLLRRVALRAAPISGEPVVKKIADFVSKRPGGNGAFRDFVNFILKCRGIDPLALPLE